MKKIFLIAVMSLGTVTAFAQEQETEKTEGTEVAMQVEAQDEYQAIDVSEVPEAVSEALNSDYPGAEIQAAYVNAEEEYKLQVVTSDGSTAELYADADGNWIEA